MNAPRPTDQDRVGLSELGVSRRLGVALWSITTALFALLHLFLHGLHIADREPWLDEASTYGVAARTFADNFTVPIAFHSQPPLYYLLLHALIRINSSEWFLRGFSWSLILVLIVLVLWWVRELTLLARLFFVFTILLTVQFTNYLSQEMRPYALCALTTFVATILFLRAVAEPTRARAIRYAVAATVMLYVLAFDVWVFTCHGLFFAAVLALRARRQGFRAAVKDYGPLAIALASTALAYLPYLWATVHWNAAIGHWSWRGAFTQMTDLSHYTAAAQSFLPLWAPYSFALYGLVLLALRGGPAERRADVILWFVICVGQIAFVQGFLFGRTPVFDRYYTPAFPAFYFLMASGVSQNFRVTRPFFLVVPLVLAMAAWSYAGPFLSSARAPLGGGEWRSVHHALASVAGRKVIFFDTGYNGQMLEYVARNDRSLVFATMKGGRWATGGDNHLSSSYIEQTIDAEATATRCFYYVVDRGEASPYYSVFEPAMRRRGYAPAASPGARIYGFCKP